MQSVGQKSRRGAAATAGAVALALAAVGTTSGARAEEAPAAATQPAAPEAPPTAPPRPTFSKVACGNGAAVRTDGSPLARAAAAAICGDAGLAAPGGLTLTLSSAGGRIRLEGKAGTIFDREQVARDAEGVAGAAGVSPGITIQSPVTIDAPAVQAAVVQAVQDANVKGSEFAAQVEPDGTTRLKGEVTHEWLAINAVKKVQGVTEICGYAARQPGKLPCKVEEELLVVPPSKEQDEALAKAVQEALVKAGLEKLKATVTKGVASLEGAPSGIAEWYRAARALSSVEGVLGVAHDVRIPGRAYRVGEDRSEAEIIADARRRLRPLRLLGIDIRVSGARVFLSGRVPSERAAFEAVEAVATVTGVQEVINALTYPTPVHSS